MAVLTDAGRKAYARGSQIQAESERDLFGALLFVCADQDRHLLDVSPRVLRREIAAQPGPERVKGRTRDAAYADRARRACHVLDHHLLPERLPHPLAEDARDRVSGTAGAVGDDYDDRPRRVRLRHRRAH